MKKALFFRRDALRRGGFTLVEVVIALAIFVFGALAIIRIFPPALGLIQNSGDQLTAINLNRSTLAQLDKSPSLVPDAIYEVVNTANPFSGAVVGTATRNQSLPRTNVQDFDNTALAHFRGIAGEKHAVSLSNSVPYVVTQYPYQAPTPAQPTFQLPLIYKEDIVDGVLMKADGTLDFSNAHLRSDISEFKDATGAYPPTAYRYVTAATPTIGNTTFYVSYSWIENSSIQSVVDEPIIYSNVGLTPTLTVQGRRKAGGSTVNLVEGPVQLRFRRLKYVAPAIPMIGTTVGDDFRGVIDLSGSTSDPFKEGEIVNLDYVVKDWRWLVSNESPSIKPEGVQSGDNYRAVITPVHFLDKDKDLYTLVIDQNKTQVRGSYTSGVLSTTGFPPASSVADPIDTKKGQVTLDLSSNTTFARSRIVYQTLDNWTQQLSVAARSYKPLYTDYPSVPAERWRDYINVGDGSLYFSPTEAGKSVAVSYTFTDGTPLVTYKINKRILQISQTTIDATAATSGVAINNTLGNTISQLVLTDNQGNPLAGSQVKSIQAVLGASIQARTAWLDGDRFTQVSSIGFRKGSN